MADVVSSQQTEANITVSQTDFLLMLIYDKLNSIEWGATRNTRTTKARVVATRTGTNTAREIGRWVMNANEWINGGALEIEVAGTFECSVGGFGGRFKLDVANAPDTNDGTAAAAYGLLPSFSTVLTCDSDSFSVAAGVGRFTFTLRLLQGAVSGTTWTQTGRYEFAHSQFPASSPPQDSLQVGMVQTNIDPSVAKWYRITFEMTAAAAAGKSFDVASMYVRLQDAAIP